MWCKKCNRETEEAVCGVCGTKTEEDIPYEIYWCDECRIPLIKAVNIIDHDICPLCGQKSSYLCTDIRPVFPEERLLFEIISGTPFAYKNSSVWASNNRYYIDGKPLAVTTSWYKKNAPSFIRNQLELYREKNDYSIFNEIIDRFVLANQERLNYIKPIPR